MVRPNSGDESVYDFVSLLFPNLVCGILQSEPKTNV